MNGGALALLLIVATIGAAIWVSLHRNVIWPESARPTGPRARLKRKARPGRAAEIEPKRPATISVPVSGVATPNDDAEMVALRAIAKLIAANLVTETVALQTVFAVKAGSSKRYQDVKTKLKTAQAELESSAELASS
jgi:hypothetical protein